MIRFILGFICGIGVAVLFLTWLYNYFENGEHPKR